MPEYSDTENLVVLNSNQRLFRAWGTVEIRDKHNTIFSVDAIMKGIHPYLSNNRTITLQHTNKTVGEILTVQEATHPQTEKRGLLVTGIIHSGYRFLDEVWEQVKAKKLDGISISGSAIIEPETGLLKEIEIYEFALTDDPSNTASKMIAVAEVAREAPKEKVALSYEDIKRMVDEKVKESLKDVSRPMGEYKDFDDCISKNQDKDDPKAYCGHIKEQVEGSNKSNEDDNMPEKNVRRQEPEAKKPKEQKPQEAANAEETPEEKKPEKTEAKKQQETQAPPPEEEGSGESDMEVVKNQLADIAAALNKLLEMQAGKTDAEESRQKEEEEKPEDESKEEEEKPEDESKEDEEEKKPKETERKRRDVSRRKTTIKPQDARRSLQNIAEANRPESPSTPGESPEANSAVDIAEGRTTFKTVDELKKALSRDN